eukprot:15482867-Alexandrium_andersonii.AAC.1
MRPLPFWSFKRKQLAASVPGAMPATCDFCERWAFWRRCNSCARPGCRLYGSEALLMAAKRLTPQDLFTM